MYKQNISDLFNRYTSYCSVIKNHSPATIKGYLATFKLFLKDTGIENLDELNKEKTEQWFYNGRLNRKWSSVTFRHVHKHINCFFDWLVTEGLLEENFIKHMEKPKLEHRLPRTLTKDEAKLVLDTSYHLNYRYKIEKVRNRAIIATMLFAGLRRKEIINLKLNDVSLENKHIFVNQGKGGKDRILPINSTLHSYLLAYLKERQKLKHSEAIHFFLSLGKAKAFGEKGMNHLMRKLRKKTKLDFSAHTLRHSFATLMLEGGCDIYTLSKMMGHNKITTTTIYLSCSTHQLSKSIEMHCLN